ncbi:tripartite tricarboxylate transporter permease [Candidatus Woesearchaeota archaeon]|nr:tripartite tricarboxylate transporter permease [Candidatus Woesearchaeota archaeon]
MAPDSGSGGAAKSLAGSNVVPPRLESPAPPHNIFTMLIQLMIAIALGISAGIITGLTPGIHINLVSLILLSISPILLNYTNPIVLCCFIIAMSVTHSFLDAIPSIFLGAPDADQALNVLPGHKLLLEGKGFEAVKLTVIGSLLCLLLAVAIVPIMLPITKIIYPLLKNYIGYLLIAIVCFMILKDKGRLMNLVMFLMSGVLGIIVLNMPTLKDPLFPLLSGLFGTSMLVVSLTQKVKIPKQTFTETIKVEKKNIAKAIGAGTLAGSLTGFFPGLGPAQGAVLASQLTRDIGDYGFMILVGGINTVNFTLSLVTLYTIEKARNGAVIVVSKLLEQYSLITLAVFIAAALIAGAASTFLALKISRLFARMMEKVNYTHIASAVIMLITALVIYFSGFLGLLVLIVATAVGIIPGLTGTARNHQMGCLILPVILFFIL